MKSSELTELTALDWIGVGLVGLGTLFCFVFPVVIAPMFANTFADFGGELPDLTQLALTVWFPLMLGLNPASLAFYGVSGPLTLGRRRLFIVLALLLSLAACATCAIAMYLPVFSLAGKIE